MVALTLAVLGALFGKKGFHSDSLRSFYEHSIGVDYRLLILGILMMVVSVAMMSWPVETVIRWLVFNPVAKFCHHATLAAAGVMVFALMFDEPPRGLSLGWQQFGYFLMFGFELQFGAKWISGFLAKKVELNRLGAISANLIGLAMLWLTHTWIIDLLPI